MEGLRASVYFRPVDGVSVVIDGAVRLGVQRYARAGDELVIELENCYPGLAGSHVELHHGPRVMHGQVLSEEVTSDASVLICVVRPSEEARIAISG